MERYIFWSNVAEEPGEMWAVINKEGQDEDRLRETPGCVRRTGEMRRHDEALFHSL